MQYKYVLYNMYSIFLKIKILYNLKKIIYRKVCVQRNIYASVIYFVYILLNFFFKDFQDFAPSNSFSLVNTLFS